MKKNKKVSIIINDLKLQYKNGGKSGEFKNDIV